MSATTSPTYLLTAATGNIGKRLVPLLLGQPSKPTLILPTSNAARLSSQLPATVDKARVHIVEGSIKDPNLIEGLLKKHHVTGVFLCLTGDDELFTTFNLLDAIRQSGCVKHLVYVSACGNYDLDGIQQGALRGMWAGHVTVKFLIEAKLKYGLLPRDQEGGFSYSIVGPTLFFDNDLRSQHAMVSGGFFNEPVGSKGVSRVDSEDIALACAKLLEDDGKQYAGKKIMIGSLKTYTMEETAQLWSQALGKDIKPSFSDAEGLKSYEDRASPFTGAAWARDLRSMFEMFERNEFGMSKEEYQEQVELLGKEASSYDQFVEDTGRLWTSKS
ncbi:NAD(P)-binding protein [Polyplosphaeria fusca]|uniref:NAD(P)-binding protein n=1 Tax=Polyplosphaeria fusca TaxID=682080 RepID=A0A9P4QNY6_9PLEO|nr:NAD(P)-binding protein [Polyplosphaeria fusca]